MPLDTRAILFSTVHSLAGDCSAGGGARGGGGGASFFFFPPPPPRGAGGPGPAPPRRPPPQPGAPRLRHTHHPLAGELVLRTVKRTGDHPDELRIALHAHLLTRTELVQHDAPPFCSRATAALASRTSAKSADAESPARRRGFSPAPAGSGTSHARSPWRGDTPTPSSCPASFLHVAHQLLRPALVRLEHAERFIGQARQVDLTEAPRLPPHQLALDLMQHHPHAGQRHRHHVDVLRKPHRPTSGRLTHHPTTRPLDHPTTSLLLLPVPCAILPSSRRQRDRPLPASQNATDGGGAHCPEETVLPATNELSNGLTIPQHQTTAPGSAGELPRLSRDFPDKQPTDFTPQDLQRYLAARRAAGCGDATIRHAVNALRSFFAYHHSPAAASLPMPRPKRRIQRTLTFDQALAVLAACDTSTTIGKRDLALVALMLDTGLRAREGGRPRLDDLNVDALLLKVVVKGGQEKFGVYAPQTANILAAWLP